MTTIFKIQMMYIRLYIQKLKNKLIVVATFTTKIVFEEAIKQVAKWLFKLIIAYFKGL